MTYGGATPDPAALHLLTAKAQLGGFST
jgi:hypothetical protein